LFKLGSLAGTNFLITGGPTREAIDPVRFISNHSSGKMAYALASEAAVEGARVTLVSGPVNLPTPEGVKRIDVLTAQEMLEACLNNVSDADVFIGVAAVADYRPQQIEQEKIKKNDDLMTLNLVKNPDIISEIAKLKNRPITVGFAAETNNIIENGKDKLDKKNLDLLFANNAIETFNSDTISVIAIDADQEQTLTEGNKNLLARNMLSLILTRLKK
jgi:phosphopantothenoylcysteine decarboxylase/phosphopantothenate--cysteine ligase